MNRRSYHPFRWRLHETIFFWNSRVTVSFIAPRSEKKRTCAGCSSQTLNLPKSIISKRHGRWAKGKGREMVANEVGGQTLSWSRCHWHRVQAFKRSIVDCALIPSCIFLFQIKSSFGESVTSDNTRLLTGRFGLALGRAQGLAEWGCVGQKQACRHPVETFRCWKGSA